MNNLTISVFKNKILLEILNELKLFSKFNVQNCDDLNLYIKNFRNSKQMLILSSSSINKDEYKKELVDKNLPFIQIMDSSHSKKMLNSDFAEQLNMPFKVLDLEKKIISLTARYEFYKSSLISLNGYIINKNERKIKKNNIELQLTEREISFLILFSQNKGPISRNFVLKEVWNYSSGSDTHTVETHVHRLRKKILETFGDDSFIKNDNKGYFI